MTPGPARQRGVAAIEFALVTLLFVTLFYGVVTFGAALYTQQAVSRAASDGARASASFVSVTTDDPRVQQVIYQSLATSLIAPQANAATTAQRLQWITATVALPKVDVSSPGQVSVSVAYPYQANPMLPPIPLTSGWMPTQLVGSATAAKNAGS